ncbi:DNA oxidative demethylase ALKBH2-like [Ptychodera flava]|uniref:DNA oxidative demethylase ALKBH2-like n=1 Tax=Ptychodera flava TaxID=63121 RepID=UPI00396A2DF1
MDKFVIKTPRSRQAAEADAEESRQIKTRRLKTDNNSSNEAQDDSTSDEPNDSPTQPSSKKLSGINLDCDYIQLFSKKEADDLYKRCERELEYNTGRLAQVQIFGKWHNIPRQQVAHGDEGLTYTFSNNCIPAKPWTPLLMEIRDKISHFTGHKFNFVLINRYKDGNDHMGEHQDDEKDLVPTAPIASLSLGQPRDFVFRHAGSRGKKARQYVPPVTVELQHGSLLMMNYPTNVHWYHSLPKRKKAHFPRINMTFREMVV